jgi:hypothetical protein
MKTIFNLVSTTIIASLVLSFGYVSFEPEIVVAATISDDVIITLNVTSGIAITTPSDTAMTPDLGISSDTSIGTTTWNVKTNNHLGYTLSVKSTGIPPVPAMEASSTALIPDYQTAAPNTWSIASGNAAFGYSAYGSDVATATWGPTQTKCSTGTNLPNSNLRYRGFTASDYPVATHNATTTPAGVDTTVCYAVQQNGFYINSGVYHANITATAVTL